MRALLIDPKAVIEAADQGLSAKEVMNAFVKEVQVEPSLKSYYEALSTDELPVNKVETVGPLPETGHHNMIVDEEGLMGTPRHFIIGAQPEVRQLTIPGRALILGERDEEGKLSDATMSVREAAKLFTHADRNTVQLITRMRNA